MTNATFAIQERLFDRLRAFVPPGEMVSYLTNVLHLSHSSVYKRINGKIVMSLGEFFALCKHFKISADELFDSEDKEVRFHYTPFFKPIRSYSDFLNPIASDLNDIKKLPRLCIYYATSEIPFFYQFLIPEIAAFKFFIYAKTVWEFPGIEKLKFSLQKRMLDTHSRNLCKQIIDDYFEIPSIEVWTRNMLDNTLRQVVFYLECGGFEFPDDAFELLNKLRKLVMHLRKMAETGRKLPMYRNLDDKGSELEIFINEFIHANNTILVASDDTFRVYTTYDNPNFLKNYDRGFGKHTRSWFIKLMKRGTPISTHSEMNRDEFFESLLAKINQAEKQLMPLRRSVHYWSVRSKIST